MVAVGVPKVNEFNVPFTFGNTNVQSESIDGACSVTVPVPEVLLDTTILDMINPYKMTQRAPSSSVTSTPSFIVIGPTLDAPLPPVKVYGCDMIVSFTWNTLSVPPPVAPETEA